MPKFFLTLGQTYNEEGDLSRTQIYGVTHWAFFSPLRDGNMDSSFEGSPTFALDVIALANKKTVEKSTGFAEFFPPSGRYFTLLTDDDKIFIATRSQDREKALRTLRSSDEIGEYFRNRIGPKSDFQVTAQDLRDYGRRDVAFCKLDDENYIMDFSKP